MTSFFTSTSITSWTTLNAFSGEIQHVYLQDKPEHNNGRETQLQICRLPAGWTLRLAADWRHSSTSHTIPV